MQQFVVIHGQVKRRPDVVLFVNGLPLAVIELKAPGSAGAHLADAFNQLQTYKQQIPALFHTNALLATSDGIAARVGSLSADLERFMPWRTTDGKAILEKGLPELPTLIEGVFEKQRFLDVLRHFTVFGETGSGLAKIVAGYHQYHAVNRAIESTIRASNPRHGVAGNRRPTGCPAWRRSPRATGARGDLAYARFRQESADGLLRRATGETPAMENPTLVVLTDRNDLDDQLFATFPCAAT